MKKKINTIDSFIIIYVILTVCSLILGLIFGRLFNTEVTNIYNLEIRLDSVDNETLSVIASGEKVVFPDLSVEGTIVGEPTASPAGLTVFDREAGDYVTIENPDKSDVIINIEITGYYTESGFRTGDNYLLLGNMQIRIVCSSYTGNATILDISDKNE